MAMTTKYPDLAHYNWPVPLDGVPLVVYKATQGTSFVDPTYAAARAEAVKQGTRLAAYHWLDKTDAAAQARHCFSVVGPDVPLMIDDEQQTIDVGRTLAFVAAYRALGGIVHLEYAPHWAWENSGRPDLRPLAAAGLHIVSSNYSQPYSDTGVGFDPYGGVTPAIWQYTDHQLWHGKYVDFNGYPGTADQLWNIVTGRGSDMALTETDADLVATKVWYRDIGPETGAQPAWLMVAGLRDRIDKVPAATAALIQPSATDVAALKAVLLSPEVLAGIAKAVCDEQDARARLRLGS